MKILKITLSLALISFLTFSCSKSDNDNGGPEPDDQLAQEQNATEDRNIPIAELSAGVSISGATVKAGLPPAPNGNVNLQISTKNQEAFQDAGFTANFSSTDVIAGAYVVFKDVDGVKADSYFDVPVSELYAAKPSKQSSKKGSQAISSNKSAKALTGDEYELDVDLSNIEPGNFCYEICLYDANSNISVIQTICVTIEAWGGNASIVGEWVFDRAVPADFDDYQETIQCTNGQSITVDYDNNISEDWVFVLSADGSYYEIYNEEYQYLDYTATVETCSAVYGDTEISNDKYSGKWAYNEDDETLTVIDFKYEDLLDPTIVEVYEDGELYFEGVSAEVVSNELVLSETYSENGQQFSITIYFKRK
ncbi:hypothetical protein WJN01_13310 [Flavobacteriaceae bacterium SZ-1-7]|uniref:hypothetical protein n=1 Tax=Tamlana sedimenti TaxID=3134126 RepID=UPI0031286FF8